MRSSGQWGEIIDRDWRWVYLTDELRLSYGGLLGLVPFQPGAHYFGPESLRMRLEWRAGPNTLELLRLMFERIGPWALADAVGGREELREAVDPMLRDAVDGLSPVNVPPASAFGAAAVGAAGQRMDVRVMAARVHDDDGRVAGIALMYKPAAGMAVLSTLAGAGDLRHFEHMHQVAAPARRPSAVLFADLEGSSALARTMATHAYFSLGRRLARAADQCVIDAGGLVGRHVGDGVVAFFLGETSGSESAAARACIQAARAIRDAMGDVAARSGLDAADLVMRFGLHWGATLYVGQITTSGRAEITALGDEVNEGARIEACATGGLALASKELIERLDNEDASALGLDPDLITYTPLVDLPTATDKARRDAPAIVVCQV